MAPSSKTIDDHFLFETPPASELRHDQHRKTFICHVGAWIIHLAYKKTNNPREQAGIPIINGLPIMDGVPLSGQEHERCVEQLNQDLPAASSELDQMSPIRGSPDPHDDAETIINSYMQGSLTVDEAVAQLAEPVEHCYSTANNGRAFYEQERVARMQRSYHEPAKAEELWGVEQDFPAPTEEEKQKPTTEGLLWTLWFAVCEASRETPWDDEEHQSKLVHLVRTIKARSDPPFPANVTIPIRRNWIWSTGTLWSQLVLLGASARESWNDSPGCGLGMTTSEIHGWTNTNAFFARLTVANIASYWNYGIWALRDVLEQEPRGNERGSQAQHIDALLPAAAVWIRITGEEAYWYARQNKRDFDLRYDVNATLKLGWQGREVWTMARWTFWKEKFRVMAGREKLADETRETAAAVAEYMQEIEGAHTESASEA